MPRFSKLRLHAEVGIALASAGVFVLTLVEPHWFEVLFDEAPDAGDGSLEAWVALGCSFVVGLVCARLAHLEWRRGASSKGSA